MSNAKVFAIQDSRPAEQMNTTDYTDQYVTQKEKNNKQSPPPKKKPQTTTKKPGHIVSSTKMHTLKTPKTELTEPLHSPPRLSTHCSILFLGCLIQTWICLNNCMCCRIETEAAISSCHRVCLFVGCLTFQQHASMYQRRTCSDHVFFCVHLWGSPLWVRSLCM